MKKKRSEKTVTLAVINYQSVWGDKSANLEKIKRMATTAAQQGNEMVVFPSWR